MCGYCIESKNLEITKALASGKGCLSELEKFWSFDLFYLQENHDAFSAFMRLEPKLSKIVAQLKTENIDALDDFDFAYFSVAFCRILEVLVKNGFESKEYQKLIAIPFVLDLIKTQCQLKPVFDEQLLPSDSSLLGIFQDESLLSKEYQNKILNDAKFISDCVILLKAYLNSCSYKKGLENKNIDPEETYKIFLSTYPYVFFSFLAIDAYYPEHDLINSLICKEPYHGVGPDNYDAWLQHKAVLKLYDTSGIAAFLPYGNGIRPQLIYYLLAKNKLDEKSKQALKESVLQSGKYDPNEDWYFAKKQIYFAPESWIMKELQA